MTPADFISLMSEPSFHRALEMAGFLVNNFAQIHILGRGFREGAD